MKVKELVKNPDAFEALEAASQELPDNSEEKILYLRAKSLKENPKKALISEAEIVMNDDQKAQFQIVK